jgi:CYTH domain-containing protein
LALETLPKYAALEIERRWLVDLEIAKRTTWYESWKIEDRYLDCGQLRRRHQRQAATGENIWKLAKKYLGSDAFSRPMTNLYLNSDEFNALTQIPHHFLKKTRHHILVDAHRWALDVFEGELAGLVMAEIECESLEAVMAVSAPKWTKREVTQDPFFSGGNLCRISAAVLSMRLRLE